NSHFTEFAQQRVAAMPALQRELALRDAQVKNLVAGKKLDLAKRIQTDRVLLAPGDAALRTLADIYRQLPAYRDVLELQPRPLPRFPNVDANDPAALLMAMGMFDEAEPAIEKRWALRPQRDALTRSYALHLGGASRASIYAVEVLMKSVPGDFHPDLLPKVVQDLLYPRYFQSYIVEDAKKYEADPTLLL